MAPLRRFISTAALISVLATAAVMFFSPAYGLGAVSPVSSYKAGYTVFSPNGDGIRDINAASFYLSSACTVAFDVKTSAGSTLRRVLQPKKLSAGSHKLYWNGKDASARRVRDAWYKLVLIAYMPGTDTVTSVNTRVDDTAPAMRCSVGPNPFWPNGDRFKDSIKAVASSNEPARTSFLFFQPGGSNLASYSVNKLSSSATYVWTGKTSSGIVGYGRFRLRIRGRDEAGNSGNYYVNFMVSPFSDINALPPAYSSAILGLVGSDILKPHANGFFSGDSEGKFHPMRGSTRGDLAVALAKCFGYSSQSPDASIKFTDLPTTSPLYKYANLAVKKGFLSRYKDGSFKPANYVSDASVLTSLVRAKGLGAEGARITKQDSTNKWYAGYLVIAHQLGLKYRNSTTWPSHVYSRRELAWSIYTVRSVPAWKIQRLKDTFSATRYSSFRWSAKQAAIIRFAKRYIGYPYVWGGDAPSEGGFDCSGLMYYDYHSNFGYSLYRTANTAGRDTRYPKISFSSLLPGDLIYFWNDSRSRLGHTGMYIGRGFFIHSSGSRCGTSIDILNSSLGSYWKSQFAWGRRILPIIKVTQFSALPKTISPNGDGFVDSLIARYRISKTARSSFSISDSAGRLVWSRSASQPAGARSISWSGVRYNGSKVPSGRYRYRLGIGDQEGNRKVFEGAFAVDLTKPRLRSISIKPTNFYPAKGRMTVSYELTEKSYVHVTVRNSAGTAVRVLCNGLLKPAGVNRTYWDGRTFTGNYAAKGNYTIRFVLKDIVLNRTVLNYKTAVYR